MVKRGERSLAAGGYRERARLEMIRDVVSKRMRV